MAENRGDKGIKSLQVALDVIEAVAASESDVGVTELALRLGLTKATVFRHLQTLVERSYLEQNAKTSRYRLGIQCHLLGQISSQRIDLLSASEEAAHWLRDQTDFSVVVSAVRLRSVVVLATHLANATVQIGERPGSELCLYGAAQGRIAAAFSRKPLLAQIKRMKREAHTPYTTVDWPDLEAKILRARERGWDDSPDELLVGLNAIAAPVFDDTADCVGTIAVVGLTQQLPAEPDQRVVAALLMATERVSVNLGYSPLMPKQRLHGLG